MPHHLVLDTSAYIGYFKGDTRIQQHLSRAKTVYIPSIVVGELYYGYYKGSRRLHNTATLKKFLQKPSVKILPVDSSVAEVYGQLKARQAITGQTVAPNDLWIAACCLRSSVPLLTLDSDFQKIEKLVVLQL